jgi:hypothetical protein
MAYVIRLLKLASGSPSVFEGQFVRYYSPKGRGILEGTRDRQKALRFDSKEKAFECWQQANGVRPDGQPNRPLTAFTIEILPLEEPRPNASRS